MRNALKTLVGKPEQRRVFERPRQRWKGIIPLNFSFKKRV
jgi:hypothetical protein